MAIWSPDSECLFKWPEYSFDVGCQLSLPGRPDEQPKWNHPYLFVERRDKATLFTPGAPLVIEYYVASMGRLSNFTLSFYSINKTFEFRRICS